MKIGKIKLISIIITCIIFCGLFINYKINKFINRNVEYKELTNPPLISVIMPIYNRKEYLGKAVKSVLNQTYQNLEIILVDDHSTDGAYEMLQEYADKDKRIKLFRNEKNSFVSATRNVGLKNATGKYLYFIDSDDWIDENYLKEMVVEAEENNLDVVVNPNIYLFNSIKNKISFIQENLHLYGINYIKEIFNLRIIFSFLNIYCFVKIVNLIQFSYQNLKI